MGRLILCSGVRTERPYVFPQAGVRIYSIEELCYYLYHHVYLIDENLFTDSLLDWIGMELKLTECADKLKILKAKGGDLKTMVTVVLCSCDYYGEKEIMSFLRVLDGVIGMPRWKRNFYKANELLNKRQYTEAISEYDRIINPEEGNSLTPIDYGDVLHNMAVATAQSKGLKEAMELFCRAFEHNHREESLHQFLYAVLLSGNDFEEKAEEYQVDEATKNAMLRSMAQIREEAEASDAMIEIQRLKQCKTEGRIAEFYRIADEIIEKWKLPVRQVFQ
ncbi:MAG: hypothetical protein E7255_05230 [Lachnospiraceae bacterium]|nr:hypothetical protein [Lachnospiraceae bacterium]